ncbi:PKS-ER domain-containing protein [Mycena indigotica]|uniref:PKS-ER domain-containing protein n=1 Tax=Mycena indigotica TaxID=2126181 RepID=A0A8H6T7E4_9AGAR|nr:PKS-ER domain-containing protein [Mycena indigotica]KAF7312285.1 PKS-ER domain-containing protein [Mycena indigotica]
MNITGSVISAPVQTNFNLNHMPSYYKRIVLASRPEGDIEPNTFRTELHPLSGLSVGDGEILVQVTWLSLDPAMRGYLRDARSYLPPVKIGETMRSQGLGVVIKAGNGSSVPVGQIVAGPFGEPILLRVTLLKLAGWTEYAVMKEKQVDKISVPKGAQDIDFLNTLGMPGLTAYFGIKEICDIKPGDKMIVSGAAGAVGSVACQLGKRAGAKVYAIAGSKEKCEWLERELGVDRAFNYKSTSFRKDLKEVGYIDVYFDNVGGDILDLILTRLNIGARIALCGAISQYNAAKPKGLQNYLTLIAMRAKIQGFIIFDYTAKFPAAIEEMAGALADGSLKSKFHVVEGIEQAPVALPWLFSGKNNGKLLVKVQTEPSAKL